MQNHAYEAVPEGARRMLHRRIGTAIEQLHVECVPGLARDLARHFDRGREPAKAAAYYQAWAQRALQVHAADEALEALDRAAELCAGSDDALYDILELRERVYARAGLREQQLADIERLHELARATGDPARMLEHERRRILYARAVDDLPEQQNATRRLGELAARVPGTYWTAFGSESAAACMRARGKYDEALREARAALQAYESCGEDGGRVRVLGLIADVCGLLAMPQAVKDAIDQGLRVARESSNESHMIAALDSASRWAYRSNEYDLCEDLSNKGLALCRTTGDREGEAEAWFRLGNVAGRRFDVAQAMRALETAAQLYDAVNKPLGTAMVLANAGVLHLKVGEFELAVRSFVRARVIFFRLGDLRGRTICSINLGMAAYCTSRYASARRISGIALKLATELGTPALICAALSNLGAAERESGDLPAALAHCEESMHLRRAKASVDIASDLADLGLTYLASGNLPEAVAIATEISTLERALLESVMYPQGVMWSAARIFAAARHEESYLRALGRASALRAERIEAIAPGPSRETYRGMLCNREILGASQGESDGVRTRCLHTEAREHR